MPTVEALIRACDDDARERIEALCCRLRRGFDRAFERTGELLA